MNLQEIHQAATLESLNKYIAQNGSIIIHNAHHHNRMIETIRTDTYQGHEIVVRTTYTLEVDGKILEGHLGVMNDGRVHYHALPNLSFDSAIDLVKELIDIFPEDF